MKDDKKILGILSHLLNLGTWILAPIIIYALSDDDFVKDNAKQSINWQLSFFIYNVVMIGFMMLGFIFIIPFIVGIPFLIILGLLDLAFIIIASVKAGKGDVWTYPLTIPFL